MDAARSGGVAQDLGKPCGMNGSEELSQLDEIKTAVGPHAGAEIHSERTYLLNCARDVLGSEASGQKQRNADAITNCATDAPIMRSAGAAEFLDGKLLIAGVEEDGVDVRSDLGCFFNGVGTGYVDHLDEGDSRQGIFKIAMGAVREAIANLNGIGSAVALLGDDVGDILVRRQEECSDGGGNRGGNLSDLCIGDDAGSAGHV